MGHITHENHVKQKHVKKKDYVCKTSGCIRVQIRTQNSFNLFICDWTIPSTLVSSFVFRVLFNTFKLTNFRWRNISLCGKYGPTVWSVSKDVCKRWRVWRWRLFLYNTSLWLSNTDTVTLIQNVLASITMSFWWSCSGLLRCNFHCWCPFYKVLSWQLLLRKDFCLGW